MHNIAGDKTIHSSGQVEAFQNDLNNRFIKVSGGTQYITTPDDYAFPLNIVAGLSYIDIRPYTDDEWKHYHVSSLHQMMDSTPPFLTTVLMMMILTMMNGMM